MSGFTKFEGEILFLKSLCYVQYLLGFLGGGVSMIGKMDPSFCIRVHPVLTHLTETSDIEDKSMRLLFLTLQVWVRMGLIGRPCGYEPRCVSNLKPQCLPFSPSQLCSLGKASSPLWTAVSFSGSSKQSYLPSLPPSFVVITEWGSIYTWRQIAHSQRCSTKFRKQVCSRHDFPCLTNILDVIR